MATSFATRLRADLRDARKRRDDVAVSALRSALGALDNAGAVPAPGGGHPGAGGAPGDRPHHSEHFSEHFAGAVAGLGATEVPRRVLDGEAERAVLRQEIAERLAAAEAIEAGGDAVRSARLRAEAAVIGRYLAGSA